MKKTQKRWLGFLLACMMVCLPVSQAMAAVSVDASAGMSEQVLFPGDGLINIGLPVMQDGAEVVLDVPGSWTNTTEGKVYTASTSEDGASIVLTEAGRVLVVENGTSSKADGSDDSGNHYAFSLDDESLASQDMAYYPAWETVNIRADEPAEGMVFAGWTTESSEVSFADAASAETTITMPDARAKVTATYQEAQPETAAPEETDPAQNPDEGSEEGGADPNAGADGDIETADSNADIVTIDPETDSTDWEETVIPIEPALDDGSDADGTIDIPAAEYTVTVNDGTGAGTYAPGSTVTVTGNDYEGKVFTGWFVDTMNATLSEAGAQTVSFSMPEADVVLSAQYADQESETHSVTINNGVINDENGATSFAEGATVSITANDRTEEGLTFAGWYVESDNAALQDSLQAATTFMMPQSDVNITATYTESEQEQTDAPQSETVETDAVQTDAVQTETVQTGTPSADVPSFSVKVENGVIAGSEAAEGSYPQGTASVGIKANPAAEGMQFKNWTVKINDADGDAATVLENPAAQETNLKEVTGNTVLTANYEAIPDPTYTVTVANGTLSSEGASQDVADSGKWTVKGNRQVAITANPNPAGQAFIGWKITDEAGTELSAADLGIADPTSASITLASVSRNLNFQAQYEGIQYKVTVNDGEANYTTAVSGTVVTITADEAPEGMEFDYWKVETGNTALSDSLSETTSFTMPMADVTVSAFYKLKEYKLTVENGTGSQEYLHMGDAATVRSNYPASGKEFNAWTDESGNVEFTDASRWKTSFTMPASDVTVKATYKDGPSTNDNVILDLVAGGEYYTGQTIKFTASGAGMGNTNPNPGDYRYRPTGYQIGNVTGSWNSSPYTTSMAIKAAGEYTLKVTYAKDVYDGSNWVADGTTDTKSVTFRVIVKAAGVATGDETPIALVIAIAAVSCVLFIILLVVFIRRRKR